MPPPPGPPPIPGWTWNGSQWIMPPGYGQGTTGWPQSALPNPDNAVSVDLTAAELEALLLQDQINMAAQGTRGGPIGPGFGAPQGQFVEIDGVSTWVPAPGSQSFPTPPGPRPPIPRPPSPTPPSPGPAGPGAGIASGVIAGLVEPPAIIAIITGQTLSIILNEIANDIDLANQYSPPISVQQVLDTQSQYGPITSSHYVSSINRGDRIFDGLFGPPGFNPFLPQGYTPPGSSNGGRGGINRGTGPGTSNYRPGNVIGPIR